MRSVLANAKYLHFDDISQSGSPVTRYEIRPELKLHWLTLMQCTFVGAFVSSCASMHWLCLFIYKITGIAYADNYSVLTNKLLHIQYVYQLRYQPVHRLSILEFRICKMSISFSVERRTSWHIDHFIFCNRVNCCVILIRFFLKNCK